MSATDVETTRSGGRVPTVPQDLHPKRSAAKVYSSDDSRLFTLGSRVPLRRYLSEMWAYREFAAVAPMAQLRAQSKETVLGRAWNLLNPLLLIAVYFLIFQVILGIETRRGVDNYLPFLTVGILTYNFLRTSTNGGALSIVRGRKLMQSLYFPRALLPISSTITQMLSHLWAIAAMVILLPIMGVQPSVRMFAFPLVLIVQVFMNLGLAFIAARFTFHFRDFQNFLSYLLRIGMYLSGVLIPINSDIVSNEVILLAVRLTPSFAVVDMARQSLLGTEFDPLVWVTGGVWSLVMFVGGFWYFRHAENEYGRV